MAPIQVDPSRIREFTDAGAFNAWLGAHHDREPEVWIKLHKVGSGLASITPKEAIDVCLCWGWIDAVRKAFDGTSYLQRYTPRGRKSIWSKINVDNVARLIAAGRMTAHGLAHVGPGRAAGARPGPGRPTPAAPPQAAGGRPAGRWDRAYGSGKDLKIPDDLQAAIDAEPQARAMLATLSEQNRFALAFRTHNLKTAAGRQKKIEAIVAMLKRGETIHPQAKKQGRD